MNVNVIRTLTMRAKTEGVAESAAALRGLGSAYDDVSKSAIATATMTETSAKRQLSMADTLNKLERQFNSAVRAQQDFEKVQRQLNAAVAQNPALQERANAILALAAERYGKLIDASVKASAGQKALTAATSGLSGQLVALSAGAGPVGVFLAALGPWGLAAAAGLGLVGAALRYVAEESARMGKAAMELKTFSDITGLTIEQIGALRRVGSDVGVSGDLIATSFERLTANLTDARRATGSLYDDVQKINGRLAQELAQTTTTAQAIDVLARAYKQAGDEALKASIARTAFGRGGAALGPVLFKIADAGGIKRLSDETKNLNEATSEQTKRWAQMQNQIEDTEKRAKNILASIFTEQGLAAAQRAADMMLRLAENAKELARQQEGLSGIQKFFAEIGKAHMMEMPGFDPAVLDKAIAAQAAIARLKAALEAAKKEGGKEINLGLTKNDLEMWNELSRALEKTGPVAATAAKSLKELQDEAAAAAKQERARVDNLGAAATVDQQRLAALKELRSKLLDNRMSAEDYAKAMKGVNDGTDIKKLQAGIAALGNSATATEQYTANVAKLRQELSVGLISQEQFNRSVKGLAAEGTISAQREMVSVLGDLATPMDQYKLRAMELKLALDRGTISQEQYNRLLTAAHPLFKNMTNYGEQFTNSLVQGMLQGKSATESLHAALKSLASSLASGALAALFRGDLFTAVILGASALVASLFGKKDTSAQDKAKADWEAMANDVTTFLDKLNGNTGSVKAAWKELTAEYTKLQDAAIKAGDMDAANKIGDEAVAHQRKMAEEFARTIDDVLRSWDEGLGSDSPFVKGMEHVKEVADEVAKYLADIKFLYGEGSDEQQTKTTEATKSATEYFLSLLTGAEDLSEISSKLKELHGTATQLQIELEKLGYSSEEAAALIAERLTKAINELIDSFYDDLERKINEVTGKGYLNKIKDLVDEITQMFSDALELGIDAFAEITEYLTESIKELVDSSSEVSNAKQDLIDAYNKEADAIKATIDTLNSAIDSLQSVRDSITSMLDEISMSGKTAFEKLTEMQNRFRATYAGTMRAGGGSADDLKNSTQGYEDFVTAAKNYLEAIKEVTAYYEQLVERFKSIKDSIAKIVDDLALSKLNPAQTYEEMRKRFDGAFVALYDAVTKAAAEGSIIDPKLFENFVGASEKFMAAIDGMISALKSQADALRQTADQLAGFIDQIDKFRASLKVDNRLSVLSPGGQLAASRAEFERLSGLAQGGDKDAAGQLTGAAKTYLDLAKNYYASSQAYAMIYRQVDAALEQSKISFGEQKSAVEQQIAALETQIKQLEDIKDTVAKSLLAVTDLITWQVDIAEQQLALLETLKNEIVAALNETAGRIDTAIALAKLQITLETWQLQKLTDEVSQYVDLNNNVKSVTQAISDLNTATLNKLSEILNALTSGGSQSGGLIGMASGGIVGGGTWNVDSVRAKFAGGGSIMLAGGEYVTTAPSVNSSTLGALDYINRTGNVPGNDNGMQALGQTIVRATIAASMAEMQTMKETNAVLAAKVDQLTRAVEGNKPKATRPNTADDRRAA